jgi:hypothetical protein
MYIPPQILSTLKTPEAIRFEEQRRTLKQAVSEAASAVRSSRQPHRPHDLLTPKQQRAYDDYRFGRSTYAVMPQLADFEMHLGRNEAEYLRRHALTLEYHAALAAYPAKLEALRHAEADARAAYLEHTS